MAQAYLCSPPEGDARPDPLADAVVARASLHRLTEMRAWLKPRVPSLTDDEITGAVTTALKRGGADGFRAAIVLKNEFSWPVDMELCLMLRDCVDALAFALRIATTEWVLRSKVRFPAKEKEQVEWIDGSGKQRAGTVVVVDTAYAAALVQPFEGLIKAGQPRRVLAEQVFANITTGERAVYLLAPDKMKRATIR